MSGKAARAARAVVIVGAGLAGARCAETLRAEGFQGRVVLVGAEPCAPYERPALSKQLLAGAREAEQLVLRPAGFWAQAGIELVLGAPVVSIDAAALSVRTRDGRCFSGDALVLCAGAHARRLRSLPAVAGLHYLRSLADALALRERLRPGSRLAVIGAGFIGAEVASTALARGVEVVLVEQADTPLERVLGPEVGRLLAEHYRAEGAELYCGNAVEGLRPGRGGRLKAVVLAGGHELRCDTALVGVGAVPASETLHGQVALAPDGGILTDANGHTNLPGLYACGDVASTWRAWLGAHLRVEHWTNAAAQAATVARAILGRTQPSHHLPYFWSDQFGLRLQHVGHADHWAHVQIDGHPTSFQARYHDHHGRLLAALLANQPHQIGTLRQELAANALAETLLAERVSPYQLATG